MYRTDSTEGTSDTVFILGAGFSFDAGIPLMAGFVDTMWDLAYRKTNRGSPLSNEDAQIFSNAIKVRHELNEYHGRAAFDDRNIEDLLSILSFNSYLPQPGRVNRLATMTKAIARTIELRCEVKHPGVERPGHGRIVKEGSELYRRFWRALLGLPNVTSRMPALITFNYDLVLERAFFQTTIGTHYSRYDKQPPFSRVRLLHHYAPIPTVTYEVGFATYGGFDKQKDGTVLNIVNHAEGDICDPNLLASFGSNLLRPRFQQVGMAPETVVTVRRLVIRPLGWHQETRTAQ